MKIVNLLKEKWSHKSLPKFDGRDNDENREFIEGKVVAHYQFLNGKICVNFIKINLLHMATFHEFDLIGERCEKNDDFQKEKQYIEGYTRFVMGAMFMKIIILLKKKSHMSKHYLMIIFCSIKFSRTKLVPYL